MYNSSIFYDFLANHNYFSLISEYACVNLIDLLSISIISCFFLTTYLNPVVN